MSSTKKQTPNERTVFQTLDTTLTDFSLTAIFTPTVSSKQDIAGLRGGGGGGLIVVGAGWPLGKTSKPDGISLINWTELDAFLTILESAPSPQLKRWEQPPHFKIAPRALSKPRMSNHCRFSRCTLDALYWFSTCCLNFQACNTPRECLIASQWRSKHKRKRKTVEDMKNASACADVIFVSISSSEKFCLAACAYGCVLHVLTGTRGLTQTQ